MKTEDILKTHASGLNVPFVDYRGRCLVAAREYDGLLFMSGFGCDDAFIHRPKPIWTGAVGREQSLEEGYKAAQWVALMHLNYVKNRYGLGRIDSVLRAYGLITAADDFYDLDRVFDGYSDMMYAAFGERGAHARTVMGTRNLPNDQTVEIEVIFKLK